jgi:hypothetical protein
MKYDTYWCDKCQQWTEQFLHEETTAIIKNNTCHHTRHLTCRHCKTNILATDIYSLQYESSITEEV